MKTILVPTDFSKNADNAMKYAIEYAKQTGSKIILLHVFETPVLYSDIPLTTVQFDYALLHDTAVKRLNNYFKKIQPNLNGVKVELSVLQGLASSRIDELALEKKADLIIMGTTGTSLIERILVGSNAARVIQKAPCFVLAIPPKAKYDGMKKIVYATDLSDDNLKHARAVAAYAALFNAELLFLTVENIFDDEDVDIKKMNARIKKFVNYPKSSGFVCTELNIVDGISYFLKKHDADCLAMYTHHRKLFKSIFSSSITKKISLHTNIPLLVVHEHDV